MARTIALVVFAACCAALCGADLDIAGDLIEGEQLEGLHVDGLSEIHSLDGERDRDGGRGFDEPADMQQRTKQRPTCNMNKAKAGDVEAQYWCGWALFVSLWGNRDATCRA